KDNDRQPERNDAVVVEFMVEKANGAGYNTVKEVALVDSYDPESETAWVTLFTGEDRGEKEKVKRNSIDILEEPDVPTLKKRVAGALSGGDKGLQRELE